ncbi:Type-2 restriction enzyme EcoRII [Burkholderia pseudomallei]|uniref:Restriction endonuclease n=1 Tax=Burkholderia pseudomallei TaxID=28450 RepID=A0AAX0UHD3_BURPE|nr:type II restriction endonuclease [Burkholderia pseudomallei]MBF3441998.1 restriction endonuclease [Burkholderia pseudomallei]MBF3466571.1 restriction endonuclease [Burkholderia pseudomallei]MBF3871129.1 restriction endonuclease [Burkholderia pseudomallei]MBF3911917.1 restriction endonuclease [Burkholderia pseudomallei]MBF4055944.1 restriction endonuclease [Burkholderia pseudomallei]
MKRGYLSEYFEGVAAKRLSAVEADETRSNQHEYQAITRMLEFMGRPEENTRLPARYVYLDDDDPDPIVEDAFLTLYNCRKGQFRNGKPRSAEFRFYFPTTNVSLNASEGDLLFIAKKRDGGLLVIIAENGSSIGRQIEWLFGFADLAHPGFSVKSELETEQDRIEFASRFILENIGIAVETSEDTYLEEMLKRFAGRFPTTREFSAYARSTLKDLSPKEAPDLVLMAWMEREEILFRTLERYLIADRLSQGFADNAKSGVDVDGFLSFSLSVQNRRKSRVGLALENHLELLFAECGIRYARTAVTENKAKPDFIFPGNAEYHNPAFNPLKLTMLGVKSTCKDRWRQVLAEADRIDDKHLLTLETAISTHQTDEMRAKRLRLVLPRKLHETYTAAQQTWLMDVAGFTELVCARQAA